MSEPNVGALRAPARSAFSTKTLVSLAMLTAIAYVVMYLSKALPSVYDILDFDFKDTIICIGGFVFGPVAAAAVSVAVAFIEMVTISTTGPWGFLMNALATCAFCCTASYIYKKRHTMKGAMAGLICGTVVLTIAMLLWNYLATPIYLKMPREAVADLLVPVFLPFNLVKGVLNAALTLVLYQPVTNALRRSHLLPPLPDGSVRRSYHMGALLLGLFLLVSSVLVVLVLTGTI